MSICALVVSSLIPWFFRTYQHWHPFEKRRDMPAGPRITVGSCYPCLLVKWLFLDLFLHEGAQRLLERHPTSSVGRQSAFA